VVQQRVQEKDKDMKALQDAADKTKAEADKLATKNRELQAQLDKAQQQQQQQQRATAATAANSNTNSAGSNSDAAAALQQKLDKVGCPNGCSATVELVLVPPRGAL
jgi:septal ring factor EnvC (AmiA/AmiB activator)